MAVAYDTVTQAQNASGTTLSWSHTCTGSDRVLFVGCSDGESSTTDSMTGATYNGVPMTLVAKNADGFGYWVYLFVMYNPPSGANTVEITRSSGGKKEGVAASYTGCNQSALDAQVSTDTASTTSTRTLTTTASNCWLVDVGMVHRGHTAGASTRVVGGTGYNTLLFDSNGSRASGSNSLVSTQSDSTFAGFVTAAIGEPGGGGGSPARNLITMGVGS